VPAQDREETTAFEWVGRNSLIPLKLMVLVISDRLTSQLVFWFSDWSMT
jgi:hypothetical protein